MGRVTVASSPLCLFLFVNCQTSNDSSTCLVSGCFSMLVLARLVHVYCSHLDTLQDATVVESLIPPPSTTDVSSRESNGKSKSFNFHCLFANANILFYRA